MRSQSHLPVHVSSPTPQGYQCHLPSLPMENSCFSRPHCSMPSLSFFFLSRTRRRTAHQYIKKKKEGEKSPKKLLQKHRNKKLLQRKGSATHPKNPNYVVSLENYKAGPKNHRTQKELGGRSQGKEIRNSSSPCCCPLLSFFLKS